MNALNKKGAIEITATAIVVLIIAIVVLGSMIYFIKQFFGETTGLIQEQLESVKQNLRKTITDARVSVAFDFGEELKLERGKEKTVFLAMKNNYGGKKGKVCYRVGVKCERAFSPDNKCPSSPSQNDVYVGGYNFNSGTKTFVTPANRWFTSILPDWNVKNNEIDIEPARIQMTRGTPDTYLMELVVKVAPESSGDRMNCEDAKNSEFEEYDSKSFRILLT